MFRNRMGTIRQKADMNRHALIFIFVSLTCANCVSLNIGPSHASKRATEVKFAEPDRIFVKDDRPDVDAAWKNPQNGNFITYLSDCQENSDPTLDDIVQGAISSLSELKVESNQTLTFQEREARRVLAAGKVDGVASQIDLLAFKRNRCIFILSYVGVRKHFAQNHAVFDRFLESFRAP